MYRSLVRCLIALTAVAAVANSTPARAGAGVDASIGIPSTMVASITADSCSNNPGPFITLEGELRLGGLTARLIFRNNVKGTHTHTEDVAADVVIIPAGESIRFAKQPPQGGVGGNPRIYLQLLDGAGNALTSPTFLGRCVQGLDAAVPFVLPTDVALDVTSGDCLNHPGPFITLEGELAFGGLNARLIFQNNVKGTHTHTEDVTVDVVILPAGESITFAKQPPLGGVGGNPRISLQFLDGNGNALGGEIFLGRCVQLN